MVVTCVRLNPRAGRTARRCREAGGGCRGVSRAPPHRGVWLLVRGIFRLWWNASAYYRPTADFCGTCRFPILYHTHHIGQRPKLGRERLLGSVLSWLLGLPPL